MITTILLFIIYLAFISLGLPDSILGVTIPALQSEFNITLSSGGIISMIVILGSVISSFSSVTIIKKIGTGKIVFLSGLTTGLSLLGFSFAPSFYWLMILALPLGLGGGAVDSALNNYVALHFKAHHMNWLHSFWGLGATLGPIIMSWNLINRSWRAGYASISMIQLNLALILLLTITIWKKHKAIQGTDIIDDLEETPKQKGLFKKPGLKFALITMLLYCAVEGGTGLWGSSYLIETKGFALDSAARFVAAYFAGITVGRVVSGFISFKLSNKKLIRYGALLSLLGMILLVLPLHKLFIGSGFILIGIGLAPIFPSMIHETPNRFGKQFSQKIIGLQMGFSYIGSALIPPTLGYFYQNISLTIFPWTLISMIVLLIFTTERLNSVVKK